LALRRRTNIAAAPAPNSTIIGGSGTSVPLLVPVVVVVEPPQCFHLQCPPEDELVDVLPVVELLVLLDVELLVDDELDVLLPEEVEVLLLPDEEPDELLLDDPLDDELDELDPDELEPLLELPELPDELPLVELQCFLQ
jgi:hypothetical protein